MLIIEGKFFWLCAELWDRELLILQSERRYAKIDVMNSNKSNPEGVPVIGISRHRLLTDGQGITTLVAFHGCPLACKYCLNPQCHDRVDKFQSYTPESLYEALKVDDLYFRATGGGVTFGGGEPLMQAEFIRPFKALCHDEWKITIETSLYGPQVNVAMLAGIVDEWIIDIKTTDEEKYREYTGKEFSVVGENLKYLTGRCGVEKDKIVIRIPVIPDYTTSEDVEETRCEFEAEGYTRFDIFTYQTEPRHEESSIINGLKPGRARCEVLKSIRREIARNNDIALEERECRYSGNCLGTCPLCEYEVEMLNRQLSQKGNSDISVSKTITERIADLRNSSVRDVLMGIALTEREQGEDAVDNDRILGRMERDVLDGDIIPPPVIIPDNPGTETVAQQHLYKEEYKRILFKECAVAGLSYHLKYDDELWNELTTGVELVLVRERKNKYDKNAVAVALADDFDGNHDGFDFDFILGYIPRGENEAIAAMIDAGYDNKFEVKITTFKRHGSINDRIRITIWLQSNEPVLIRPNLLRVQPLDLGDMRAMRDELQRRGTVHFRWGGFPPWERNLPEVGDEVVFMNHHCGNVMMYHMRVMAIGEDAKPYLDDPSEADMVDDCTPYVLTNMAGPVIVRRYCHSLAFLASKPIQKRSVYEWLEPAESDALKSLIEYRTEYWLSRNNVDADPSIDEPIER